MVKKKLYIYSNAFNLLIGIIACVAAYGVVGIPVAITLQVMLGLLLLLGFIPIIGVIIYGWYGWFNIIPMVASFFGIEWTWALSIMFILNLIISTGCTLQAIIRIFTPWWRIGEVPKAPPRPQ